MSDARLGRDIALTRSVGTASMVPLAEADSWGTLDARVKPGMRRGLPQTREPVDLATAQGRDNLAQALILRLLTPKGALRPLGHPDYGSRLPELIGEREDARSRNRARLYVLEALAQEARVTEVLDLTVTPVKGQPGTLAIAFRVGPATGGDPIGLALDVTL